MCDFISWFAVKREGETHYLYLTDAEVFSERGQELFLDSKDNDILGHQAIKLFYNLSPYEGGGSECLRFWRKNADIPAEIKQKIQEFDVHWGRMWRRGAFQTDDLCDIIRYASRAWKEKAAETLMARKDVAGYDLGHIVCEAPEAWKRKAWEALMARKDVTGGDLCNIVICAPEAWKRKAWEALMARKDVTGYNLRYIICNARSAWWKRGAWKAFMAQKKITRDDLRYIIIRASKAWRMRAWEVLVTQKKITRDDLRYIINNNVPEPLASRAQRLLLKR